MQIRTPRLRKASSRSLCEPGAAASEETPDAPEVVTRTPPWAIVRPAVIAALVGLNYPLRLLPDPLRQIVDWIALTLIFWVPIVWALALFL